MLNFCTYFDINYIHRGLALYESLCKTGDLFTLWILCFDDRTYEILDTLKLPHARLIHCLDFEAGDEALLLAKGNRSTVEYYWTCTPSLLLYLFKHYRHIQMLTYVDADVYFFSTFSRVLEMIKRCSILIVPHDYSPEFKGHETSGKYNVGVMTFRADENGLSCLEWWRDRCLEWCYSRHEDGKMGDQAYLDEWPDRFQGVVISSHVGVNAAPWNVGQYPMTLSQDGQVVIADWPLVCYHFHGIKFCTQYIVFIMGYNVRLSRICISSVYYPYLKNLNHVEKKLKEYGYDIPIRRSGIPWRYILGRVCRLQPIRHFIWV